MGLFSTVKKESQMGVDFLPDDVAVARVQTGNRNSGDIVRSVYISADGQEAQTVALKEWVGI